MTPRDIHILRNRISLAMLRDQHPLHQRLRGVELALRQKRPWQEFLAHLNEELSQSIALREQRLRLKPKVSFPTDLPVAERRREIETAIQNHQVVVICGETGSGKTTQLPKICLELGRGIAGTIGHTQPRRIAARAVAARIAEELNTKVGQQVGFKIRFSDNVSPTSHIKLMTDGILLAETQSDRTLSQYDTLIIDEAHERSLNIDFLLGYIKQLLPKRPDLKLIITSATINPQEFSAHFDNCPIVMVSGRTYPVETRYRDPHAPVTVELEETGNTLTSQDLDEDEPDLLLALTEAVKEVCREGPGDILIFLSGEREIREAQQAIEESLKEKTVILPLYSRLSSEEQQAVFLPNKKRKIVLATNVAETSLTVPGIKYVIDPGLARISRYSPRTKVQRLPIEPISQASANQRQGRCGRVSSGICVRLYSEENFRARPLFTEPEILRTHLASVILQMKYLKLGSIEDFPFLERPSAKGVLDGYQTLLEIGAVDPKWNLTPLGSQLARLPIDPRIARMILAAESEGCHDEVLIIAAALSVQDPRERPLEKQQAADTAHLPFKDPDSDFLSFLKLWNWYHDQSKKLSSSKLRRACQAAFLSYTRMREWHDIHQQLVDMLSDLRPDRRNDQRRDPRVTAPPPRSSPPPQPLQHSIQPVHRAPSMSPRRKPNPPRPSRPQSGPQQ
jgi:ATP-dependent helicase HrpA